MGNVKRMATPAAKKQKTEEVTPAAETKEVEVKAAEEKKEVPKAPEPPKELEQDAPKASGPKVKDPVAFLTPDTTMNVMNSTGGNILMSLGDGGVRQLLAGARASVGLKSGRYMFEAKIMENTQRAEGQMKSVFKVGFSTAGSSLLMGDCEASVSFDSDGGFVHNKKRTVVGGRFGQGNVVAVLLNLEKGSPNANTVSLFKDGKRVGQPQALPESLVGKTLYPTLTYRNITAHVNFGPEPLKPLPFTCAMVQEAATKDSAVTSYPAPKDGKYEVLFPVALPDQGGFDWLDLFKAKNPDYTELSDRMILEWSDKSGVARNRAVKTSNDKPEMDDLSVRRMLQTLAPLQPRNFIVMEVKGNLIKELRSEALGRFFDVSFKKVGQVLLGEPTSDIKKNTLDLVLKQKQADSDAQFRRQKAEEARKKMIEKRQKELEKAKLKLEKAKKRKLEEVKKAAEKAKAGDKAEEEKKDPEEEKKEEEEGEEAEVEEPAAKEEQPPNVELTAEEKQMVFRKLATSDLTLFTLNTSFAQFSVPSKEEGFDEVRFEWNKEAKAQEYLKKWILDLKQSNRVEDIVPSAWFQGKWAAWQRATTTWNKKQAEYKAKLAKKAADKVARASKKALAEKAAALKAAADLAKMEQAKKDGKEVEEEKKEEQKPEPMEVEEEVEEVKVDFDGVDIFGAKDVDDIGGGMPLYRDFNHEDWSLMSLCFELHLLSHAFKKDCQDADRLGVTLEHLGFYYNKYYKKALVTKAFGAESSQELLGLAKDCVFANKDQVIQSTLDEEMECSQVFVKIVEQARRHRTLLLDTGDTSAQLKILSCDRVCYFPVLDCLKHHHFVEFLLLFVLFTLRK
ncbi:unnamed protein product [Polarella glacialis]|uniref:B30.2/SPRY domain-containing protein n=1 Tax=Polarella glacialis TaxID=89957 RepID=A0A813ILP8_POLGL|nr:unnamed protein product [Polarella glacialis]